MGLAAWITIAAIVLVVVALLSNRVSPDLAMMGGLIFLLVTGVAPPREAISGFAERAVIMIAAIYIVAAGLTETGATELLVRRLLGQPRSYLTAQVRLMVPVAIISAFLNTTAVVAMYIPLVSGWARRLRMAPSRLFIPLSFSAILGGTCTLIGTSSNITLAGLYQSWLEGNPGVAARFSLTAPAFWYVAVVGVPSTIAGIGYLLLASRRLIPERAPIEESVGRGREYRVEVLVQESSPVVGHTIAEAGLRHLPGLFLAQIQRGEDLLPAVSPEERVLAGDILVFIGAVDSVRDLRRIRGLVPATTALPIRKAGRQGTLAEAVVSPLSPLIGQTVRESRFRTLYNAVILGVHRAGRWVPGKIGDIRLHPGDTLLLETHAGFADAYRNRADFYMVSEVPESREPRHERAWMALGILGLLVGLLAFSSLDRMVAALGCAALMVLSRCVPWTVARKNIQWQVLIVIAAAIGIGRTMEHTGVAAAAATGIIDLFASFGPHGLLVAVYLATSLLAQLVSNNGAAVLMFPVAMSVAQSADVSPLPFVICLMSAAACSFITPIAYQTNLMVYGPGGYRFTDYTRVGLPLTLIVCGIVTTLAPLVFPF